MYFTSMLNSSKKKKNTHTRTHAHAHTGGERERERELFYIICSPDDGLSGAEMCPRNIKLSAGVYVLPNKRILLEFNN